MQNYYKDLPESYKEVYHLDAKDKKVSITLTLFSLLITALSLVIIFLIKNPLDIFKIYDVELLLIPYLVFFAGFVLYVILHELVHGAAYKILTGQKLTFGLTLTVAFCGVPNIYTSRKTALIALCSPLVVFSILFISLMAFFYSTSLIYFTVTALLFSLHIGGCIGDMYMTYILLFKYTDKRLLMKDTGPAQTLYLPE